MRYHLLSLPFSGQGVGDAVEKTIYDHLFQVMAPVSSCWTTAGNYQTIALPSVTLQQPMRVAEIKAWGTMCALHILRLGTLPPKVSPFLIQVVISGMESILDLDFINNLAPEQSGFFWKWLNLSPTEVLTYANHGNLIAEVSSALSLQVRDF